MKKSISIIVLAAMVSIACLGQMNLGSNQPEANRAPVHFAEGVIETSADEYNPTFTPDGKTVFFTRRADRKGRETIMFSRFENGKWRAPANAPFSGTGFFDKEPFVSPDGGRIFFASTRPNERDAKNNFDLWYVEKTDGGAWSEAKNLGAEINSPGYDNYPSVAADGTLYFGSKREGGGEIDLYRSRLVNGVYQKPENLGDAINTPATEADPFVAPDQSYLIFCSDRAGGEGEGDLYVSFNRNGVWTVPQSLGKIINTPAFEYTPLVSPDGKTFYFSRGWGEIFQTDAAAALNLSALEKSARLRSDFSNAPLDAYTGEYELMPGLVFTVSLESGKLFGGAKGNRSELRMTGEDRFAADNANVQVTFVKDADGKVSELILAEDDKSIRVKKIK